MNDYWSLMITQQPVIDYSWLRLLIMITASLIMQENVLWSNPKLHHIHFVNFTWTSLLKFMYRYILINNRDDYIHFFPIWMPFILNFDNSV
jgi:hypothetical protein